MATPTAPQAKLPFLQHISEEKKRKEANLGSEIREYIIYYSLPQPGVITSEIEVSYNKVMKLMWRHARAMGDMRSCSEHRFEEEQAKMLKWADKVMDEQLEFSRLLERISGDKPLPCP